MSDIGGLDTVEETTEEKVVEMTEKKERKPFHYWTVNGRENFCDSRNSRWCGRTVKKTYHIWHE